ncbi:Crp/Fnr family transcriptional regulator [Pseudooceanicola sp. LIPI14-2-Ac024]|uniref:Crp/Fnr family transcriptional regulator n=1 Tax=Pseudooceanicola sp. LIPI14-2-Ac024 TaxID=3344875 RepID=UPI0035D02B51
MITIMSDVVATLTGALPADAIRSMSAPSGTQLFCQGDRPRALFALRDGRVDLMRWTSAGSAVRVHAAGPGETLAEASLFAEAYHCDALVREDATVIRFALPAVLEACETSPILAFALMRHLASSLRDARRRVELRAVNPLTDRLLLRLAELADAEGHLPETLVMKDIAAEIGATPEATYRAMAQLTRQGRMIRDGRARLRVPVPEGAREKSP